MLFTRRDLVEIMAEDSTARVPHLKGRIVSETLLRTSEKEILAQFQREQGQVLSRLALDKYAVHY